MKLYESGEDYLEALLILQNRMGYAQQTSPGTWGLQNPVYAMQYLFCVKVAI